MSRETEAAAIVTETLAQPHIATLACHYCGWQRFAWLWRGESAQAGVMRAVPDLVRHITEGHPDETETPL